MEDATRIDLEDEEAAVLQAASRLFSAYIAGNQVNSENEEALFDKSIGTAIRMAKEIDIRISAGNEVETGLQNDPNYRPLG